MNPSSRTRDPRLDFFRGLALVCIFVDHTPGNRLTDYTIRNLGFSDASELFVFISACTAGLVYMPRVARDGLGAVSRRIGQRVLQVYGAHLLLLGVVAVVARWLTRTLRDPQFVNGLNVGPLLERPRETLLEALALTFQPTFMNILPLYIVLLASLPLMLWLIRCSQGLALLLSLLLYAAARVFPLTLDNPFGKTWEFNPLAWQLLFVIGVSLGAGARGGSLRVPRSRVLLVLAAVYAVWAYSIGPAPWAYDANAFAVPQPLRTVLFPVMDRANLSLWRLADLLALAYLATWFLGAGSPVFRWRVSRALILCGQHSLTLFCAGVLLSIAGWAVLATRGGTLPVQIAVNVTGCAALVVIAWLASLMSGSARVASAPAL